jgi:hypothetical protein
VSDDIIARIERESGVSGLVTLLAERLAPTDLQSLLLEVARRRAAATTPASILRRYEESRFVRPTEATARDVEAAAFAALSPVFERVVLSPVTPLGTVSSLAPVSQDWVVATMRGTEVVSDPTNVLALECALRRRRDRESPVHLAASHRTLRAQAFAPPFSQHFQLFALCSAGRAADETRLREEHLAVYARLFDTLGASFELDERPRKEAYYLHGTFGILSGGAEVAEGGFVDWTQRLLADRKERLFVSGIGLEAVGRIKASTRR